MSTFRNFRSGKVGVNADIAIVVPAQDIIDTLMDESLVEERDKTLEELRAIRSEESPSS